MSQPPPPARLFRAGRLFDGTRFLPETDLRTGADGRITAIGSDLETMPGEEVVDLAGRLLMPGLVDCHVHFREPGLERKEGYAYGSRGALHGGVTTVCEIQNNPPLMASTEVLRRKLENLKGVSHVDYAPYGSLVEESLNELDAMKAFCPAVKCFLGCSTGAGGVADESTLRRWFHAAAEAGIKVVAHCEDNDVMDAATEALADDPELSDRHDLRRSREAEVESIRSAIQIAGEVGAILHVFHISTAEGATMVATAAGRGQAVTGSTAPHYLLVTAEEAHAMRQNRFKVNPSIKYEDDRSGLLQLVASGILPAVGTDHAPHPLDEKNRPYAKAPSGFPSIDAVPACRHAWTGR
ncbi:MAG: dihydroorotase [Planctomycetota bacterium]|jgi:dihydroorotase